MKLSIVTPSFGQLDWLRLCMASVRDQVAGGAGPSVEHLVQDAGTAGIEAFARVAGAAHLRGEPPAAGAADASGSSYRASIQEAPDSGMYDALNRGLRRATGEVCGHLNCDEQYLPGVLARVARWFEGHPETEILFCDAVVVDAQGRYISDRRVTLPTPTHTRVSGNLSIFTGSTFFRRSVLERRGLWFDSTWRALGDAEWVTRLLAAGVSMATLRLRASVHTDTGENLALSPVARAERARLASRAPRWARSARPLIVLAHRLRRLRAGAYTLEPHGYAIYTRTSPTERVAFDVPRPTFRWQR